MLFVGLGSYLGLLAITLFGTMAQGGGGGLKTHLTIAGGAVLAVVPCAVLLRRNLRATFVSMLVTVAALALFSGIAYPDRVIAGVERVAGNLPFCVMLGTEMREPMPRGDLMFISMPKGDGFIKHQVMVVDAGDRTDFYNWSLRQRRFFKGASRNTMRLATCQPRLGALETLK